MLIDWNLICEDRLTTLPEALVAVQSARARIEKLEEEIETHLADKVKLRAYISSQCPVLALPCPDCGVSGQAHRDGCLYERAPVGKGAERG